MKVHQLMTALMLGWMTIGFRPPEKPTLILTRSVSAETLGEKAGCGLGSKDFASVDLDGDKACELVLGAQYSSKAGEWCGTVVAYSYRTDSVVGAVSGTKLEQIGRSIQVVGTVNRDGPQIIVSGDRLLSFNSPNEQEAIGAPSGYAYVSNPTFAVQSSGATRDIVGCRVLKNLRSRGTYLSRFSFREQSWSAPQPCAGLDSYSARPIIEVHSAEEVNPGAMMALAITKQGIARIDSASGSGAIELERVRNWWSGFQPGEHCLVPASNSSPELLCVADEDEVALLRPHDGELVAKVRPDIGGQLNAMVCAIGDIDKDTISDVAVFRESEPVFVVLSGSSLELLATFDVRSIDAEFKYLRSVGWYAMSASERFVVISGGESQGDGDRILFARIVN